MSKIELVLFMITLLVVFIGLIFSLKKIINNEDPSTLFFTTGIGFALDSFGGNFLSNLNFAFSNIKNWKTNFRLNLSFSQSNFSSTELCTGIFFVVIGVLFVLYTKKRLFILNINGYSETKVEDHYKSLKLSQFSFKEKEIDIINDIKVKMTNDEADRIIKRITRKVDSFKEESKDNKRAYTGIAQIPFIVYAGTLLRKVNFDRFFEFDKMQTHTYRELSDKCEYEKLENNTDFSKFDKEITDILVAISTTKQITNEKLSHFKSNNIVQLALKEPKDNAIQSKQQLVDYKNKIIDVLNDLQVRFPKLEKFHLFISSQSCLPFEIGKVIEDYRNAETIVYHFDMQSEEKYPWGIVINGKNKGKFVDRRKN